MLERGDALLELLVQLVATWAEPTTVTRNVEKLCTNLLLVAPSVLAFQAWRIRVEDNRIFSKSLQMFAVWGHSFQNSSAVGHPKPEVDPATALGRSASFGQ